MRSRGTDRSPGAAVSRNPRIGVVHATPLAMPPTASAFAACWPEARQHNLLDDTLLEGLGPEGRSDEAICGRFAAIARYARRTGAVGLLFTCSAFGEAIDHAARRVDIPVVKPNEAMFMTAFSRGPRSALLATSEPAAVSLAAEYRQLGARLGRPAELDVIVVSEARAALDAGDGAAHDRLLARQAATLASHDSIMLAHFSTGRAATAVRHVTDIPVLAAPEMAVLLLRQKVEGTQQGGST